MSSQSWATPEVVGTLGFGTSTTLSTQPIQAKILDPAAYQDQYDPISLGYIQHPDGSDRRTALQEDDDAGISPYNYPVVYQVTGDGREWSFLVSSDNPINSALYCPADPSQNALGQPDGTIRQGVGSAPYPRAAFRATLKDQYIYFIEVGHTSDPAPVIFNAGWTKAAVTDPDGDRYQLDTSLATPTPAEPNVPDLKVGRSDAWDAFAIGPGHPYTTGPYLNTDFTNSGDPSGHPLTFSGWWVYQPVDIGSATITVTADVPYSAFRANFYRADVTVSGGLAYLGTAAGAFGTTPFQVDFDAFDQIYIQCGYGGAGSPSSSGQRYSITIDGVQSYAAIGGGTNTVEAKERGTSTLIELVRAWQQKSGVTARILDAKTVQAIDLSSLSLPSGFHAGNITCYSGFEMNQSSGVNAVGSGTDWTGHAKFIKDDIGVLTSGFEVPGPLPGPPGVKTPNCSRFSYTITPTSFQAEADLYWMDGL